MIHLLNMANKYIVLFFIILNCMIVISASPLATDSVETASLSNENKIAVPEELQPNVVNVSKTAAITPTPEPIDDESRSIKLDVINDDSVTSEIISRTDFTPTEAIKEKRSTSIDSMSFLSDSDLRSDLDAFDIADAGPIGPAREETEKSADDSDNQDLKSDIEDTVRTEQAIDEKKSATEMDDSNVGRTDTEVKNERVASIEESSDNVRTEGRSSDNVRTEGRDAEETVEFDSPTDGFIRGSRRMLESGDIVETKGRSGDNVDITRSIPAPDLRSLNTLNPIGSGSTSRISFQREIIPHIHTVLNSPSIVYPNVYGIPAIPNMIMNRVASAEMKPLSRSYPFYPDNRSYAQAHTHAHASAETNSANQLKPKELTNTYPYIPTQNTMDARQIIPNNFDLLKKLTDASSLPIKPTLFSGENVRPFSNLFNSATQGFPPNMNQYSAPRIRRSVRKQRRFQQNFIL